jgi:hypothetical protein
MRFELNRRQKVKAFPLVAVAVIALMDTAHAETPFERCVTNAVVNVTTLPMATDKMWHQLHGAGGKTLLSSTGIWFKLPNGSPIDLYVSYVDPQGVEWDWGSGNAPGYGDAIVTGWVKHSSLKCPR